MLGFFLFAFMYGALGSLASHSEDINTLTLPVNFLLIAALIITMVGVTGDKMESMFVKIFSFVPFTSPLVMFSRICMSEVPPAEIAISVGVLFASIVLTGLLASKIYRLGVLMYGKPPRIRDIAVLALQRTK